MHETDRRATWTGALSTAIALLFAACVAFSSAANAEDLESFHVAKGVPADCTPRKLEPQHPQSRVEMTGYRCNNHGKGTKTSNLGSRDMCVVVQREWGNYHYAGDCKVYKSAASNDLQLDISIYDPATDLTCSVVCADVKKP